jgi:hypothetical protein
MGLLITTADFVDKFYIPNDADTTTLLNSYIDRYEKKYLIELLGVELYKLFEADINGTTHVPQTGIYTKIYEEILEDSDGDIYISKGMKDMLLGFIWFEFVREYKYKFTASGHTVSASENSNQVRFDDMNIYGRYNESVSSYEVIQWYIMENESDYPDFNGKCKSIAYWI